MFSMDQYAKYSYTIISDQLLKLNPRLIMLFLHFCRTDANCQDIDTAGHQKLIAADVF